jgi:hypothetical protein
MAIFSAVPPPPELQGAAAASQQAEPQPSSQPAAANTPIDIEAWAVSAFQSLSVSPTVRGSTPLSIPLDNHDGLVAKPSVRIQEAVTLTVAPPRWPLSRRDSMKRREALLKGKEGSRQRRRWENGT